MITYEEVADWWEGTIYNLSTFPPSAWFNYAEQEGLDIEDLRENADEYEDGVEELHAEGDGRTCECEWAEHETNCNWTKESK